jgi:hypothetical protein
VTICHVDHHCARFACYWASATAQQLEKPFETCLLLQQWLAIPAVTGQSEMDLSAATGDDGMCTDPEFPPDASSLYADPSNPPGAHTSTFDMYERPTHLSTPLAIAGPNERDDTAATASPVSSWKRVHGQLYIPEKQLVSILPVRPPPPQGCASIWSNAAHCCATPVCDGNH